MPGLAAVPVLLSVYSRVEGWIVNGTGEWKLRIALAGDKCYPEKRLLCVCVYNEVENFNRNRCAHIYI